MSCSLKINAAHVPSHPVAKWKVSFSILCAVPRSHNNDPESSTTNTLLGIQWNYKRW